MKVIKGEATLSLEDYEQMRRENAELKSSFGYSAYNGETQFHTKEDIQAEFKSGLEKNKEEYDYALEKKEKRYNQLIEEREEKVERAMQMFEEEVKHSGQLRVQINDALDIARAYKNRTLWQRILNKEV